MADKKITQLDELFAADSVDVFAIVDLTGTDETKKITVSNLMGTPGPIGATVPDEGTFTALELATGPQVDEISTDTNLGTDDDVLPTQNAVKEYVDNAVADVSSAIVNPIHISGDSTSVVGDVLLVDTTNGNVSIEMIETPKGKITVKKISPDGNIVIITPRSGTIDGNASVTLNTQWEALSFVTDTVNFYID